MRLTAEQQDVLDTNSNLVINAVAGSGKTTTLEEELKLAELFGKGVSLKEMARKLGRGENGVRRRRRKLMGLGLPEEDDVF